MDLLISFLKIEILAINIFLFSSISTMFIKHLCCCILTLSRKIGHSRARILLFVLITIKVIFGLVDLYLDYKRIMRDHYKNGINHVNSLHSQFKKWMDKFNGVSTKFLENYLHWFKWLQCFKYDKDIIKAKIL